MWINTFCKAGCTTDSVGSSCLTKLTPQQDQLCAADLILQSLIHSYACACPSVRACQSVTVVADTEDDLKEVYDGVIRIWDIGK